MKKALRRLAAIALLALMGVLVAVPAWADTTYTAIGGSCTIVKNLVVEENANIPDITFSYRIQRGTEAAPTASTIEILASDKTAEIGSVSFTNSDTSSTTAGKPTDTSGNPTSGYKYAQKQITVTFPSDSFTKPGVYRYVVEEEKPNPSPSGVTYDTSKIYLDVFVVIDESDASKLKVQSYVLRKTESGISKTDNAYATNPSEKTACFTNEISEHNFEFSKTITGNQGVKDATFTFTLQISGAIPGVYPIQATNVIGNPTSITVESNGTATATYDLTDGSSVKIIDLNNGAQCTVSEDPRDYTATHVVDGGSSVSGNTSGAISVVNTNHTVAFTNKRDGVIPTGVIIAVAPFAAGLVIFGGGAVYLSAKKNRDEE